MFAPKVNTDCFILFDMMFLNALFCVYITCFWLISEFDTICGEREKQKQNDRVMIVTGNGCSIDRC